MKAKFSATVMIFTAVIFIASCNKKEDADMKTGGNKKDTGFTMTTPEHYDKVQNVSVALAELNPASGSNVRGLVTFTKTDSGMHILAEVHGLTPGKHGFHIHENGDCSAPDASSAGGHYNPQDMPHAGHDSEKRHVGDMGNITADKNGDVRIEFMDKMMSFDQGRNNILGRAIVVHEKADDLKTQPSGDAGGRVACGVILPAKQ